MGLIHSRASKKRDKAQAGLLKAQREAIESEQARSKPWYEQKTLGGMIAQVFRSRKNNTPAS
jgi:hypothetical protein